MVESNLHGGATYPSQLPHQDKAANPLQDTPEIDNSDDTSSSPISQPVNSTLAGKWLLSRGPIIPDVQKKTKIVALCTAHESNPNGKPSPGSDGRFVSDFYLCHELFRGACEHQVWLHSSRPEDLVERYGDYDQGDPGEQAEFVRDDRPSRAANRKIVLSKEMLDRVQDVTVVDSKDITDRFLAEVRKACQASYDDGCSASVLLLIFGHGIPGDSSIHTGWDPTTKMGIFLQPAQLCEAVTVNNSRDVSVTLVTTSYSAGDWAVHKELNATSFLPSDFYVESDAWSSNWKTGSASGGVFVNAMVKMLARLQIEGLSEDDLDSNDPTVQTSVAGAATLVSNIMHNEVELPLYNPKLTFSSQDDLWAMSFGARTGFPFADFYNRWNELPNAPPVAPRNSDAGEPATETSMTGSGRVRTFQLGKEVRIKGIAYLQSHPGRDTASNNNTLHNRLHALINNWRKIPDNQLESMASTLAYRIYHMDAADRWVKALGVSFDKCKDIDNDKWLSENPGKVPLQRALLWELWKWRMVDAPLSNEGLYFAKGYGYLACAFANADLSVNTLRQSLQPFFKHHVPGQPLSGIPNLAGVSRVMDKINATGLDRDASVRGSIREIAKSLKRIWRDKSPIKLLQLSPQRKSRRGTLPEDWQQQQQQPGSPTLKNVVLPMPGPSRK